MKKKLNVEEITVHAGPEKSPGFLLWHVSTAWRSALETTLKQMNLTHPQFVVLATLGWLTRKGNRVTQASVGKLAGLDPNTLSQILKGLEKKTLIMRAASLDGRVKNPFLTPQGEKVLAQALPAVETTDAQFFNQLTSTELESTIAIFQKLTLSKQ